MASRRFIKAVDLGRLSRSVMNRLTEAAIIRSSSVIIAINKGGRSNKGGSLKIDVNN